MEPYLRHRKALEKKLPDGLILVSGGMTVSRNHDVDFVFRQKSDFLYLTGVEEPGCHLLIDPRRKSHTLFIPRIDNHHRVWLGHVPGPAEAKKLFGVSRVLYSTDLPRELSKARRGYRKAYLNSPAILRHKAALPG
ncbi:MAG: aminopeptidase P N-terminal domain-containing protein, partial [Nitrospirota bacterium]